MSGGLADRLKESGKLEAVQKKVERSFYDPDKGVPDSSELRRILHIPRRYWDAEEIEEGLSAEDFRHLLTDFLKTPHGQITLHLEQAVLLKEIHDWQAGGMAIFPVGSGKTILSFLAPTIVGAVRPLLVIPAKLVEKTRRDFEKLSEHFRAHPSYHIVTYEKISHRNGTEVLEEICPDFFVFDEAHRIKNPEAAVTRRFKQWFEEHPFPETRALVMSGTMTSRSLYDFAHALRWAVRPELQPIPNDDKDLELWAAAIDEIKDTDTRRRMPAGCLKWLFDDEEKKLEASAKYLDAVRRAFNRRLGETPTIVRVEGKDYTNASLNIEVRPVEGYNKATRAYFAAMFRSDNPEMPNGDPVTEFNLTARWAACRTLTSGFWYRWDPPPPVEWLRARRAWKAVVRALLELHRKGLESELLIANAVIKDKLDFLPAEQAYAVRVAYTNWARLRDSFKPNTVPTWIDDTMVHEIVKWTKQNKGIVWVSEVALGNRLEADFGLPYYGAGGRNKYGNFIEDARPSQGAIVASFESNHEGRNLQAWDQSLVVSPHPIGAKWEQLLGRLHRQGQMADEVWYEVLVGCHVELQCFQQALRDAQYQSRVEGAKKLVTASVNIEKMPWGSNELWRVA